MSLIESPRPHYIPPLARAAHAQHQAFNARIRARAQELAKGQRALASSVPITAIREPREEVPAEKPKDERFLAAQAQFRQAMRERCPVSIRDIQAAVCAHYGVAIDDLIGPRRFQKLARPRMVAIYLCRIFTKRSYPELGRHFGKRDYSTAIHADQKIGLLVKSDHELVAVIDELKNKIAGGANDASH